ncbi:MAG: choice-of-anchor L domain-containing protein, partial [Lewinella sp.]|nr:choice-of-anchor L domain-containing protein [Lewinella sp.]
HLINEVFIANACFEVSNITISGMPGQIGSFSEGASSIGMANGIVMSTGDIASIPGPNTQPNTGTNMGNGEPDPDIVAISGNGLSVRDPVVIEFDFVPTVDSISFEYVLASEEYCEWSPSSWNDAFGFFLSGPGISGPYSNGSINIALLPDDITTVTINNVNPFVNSQYYVNNIPASQGMGCAPVPGLYTELIEFDGFTVPLTARAQVTPCETYHIKLVIADRSDAFYDSAVFLKAGSFTAGLTAAINTEVIGEGRSPVEPYEGCATTSFIFTRADSIADADLIVYYDLLPSSTATEGLDFSPIPDSVIIPAGALADTLLIDILSDNLTEGEETIILKLRNPCRCSEGTISVSIIDPVPLQLAPVSDISLCRGDSVLLTALPTGGVGDLAYQWNDFGQDSLQYVTPEQSGTYSLIVTDQCFQSDTITYLADVQYPQATLTGAGLLCDGLATTTLPIALSDGQDFNFTVSGNGMTNDYSASGLDTFWLSVTAPGLYTLMEVSADGCSGLAQGTANVTITEITTQATVDSVSCFGTATGSVQLSPANGLTPYSFQWSHEPNGGPVQSGLAAGPYTVTITDAQGCTDTLSLEVPSPLPLEVVVDTLIGTATCEMGGSLQVTTVGGSAPYIFSWADNASSATRNNLPPGAYTVTVTDGAGCTSSGMAVIGSALTLPQAQISPPDQPLDCQNESVWLDATASSQGSQLVYHWSGPTGDMPQPATPLMVEATASGWYTLTVLDTLTGCQAADSIFLEQLLDNLVIDLPSDSLTLNCQVDTLSLAPSVLPADWSWNWTTAGGQFSGPTNTASTTVVAPGQYVLTATRPDGCTGADSLMIGQDTLAPSLQLQVTDTLNCATSSALLQALVDVPAQQLQVAWLPSADLLGPLDQPTVTATAPGWYSFSATNIVNGCTAQDSVEVVANEVTIALPALPDTTLTCAMPQISIDGQSATPGDLAYSWLDSAGNEVGTAPVYTVTAAGTYTLRITDLDSQCAVSQSLTVGEDLTEPLPDLQSPAILTCTQTSVELGASVPDEPWYPLWTNAAGDTLATGSWTTTTSQPGPYALLVVDPVNGCSSLTNLIVQQDTSAWPGTLTTDSLTLTCDLQEVILAADGPSQSPYQFAWSGTALEATSVTPSANVVQAGSVQLIVTDSLTGCTRLFTTGVTADLTPPTITGLSADTVLNCYQPTLSLQADEPAGAHWMFSWTNADGEVLGHSPTLPVEQGGAYQLEVLDQDNGCASTQTVLISTDQLPPTPTLTADGALGCLDTLVSLQGSTSVPQAWPIWLQGTDTLQQGGWSLEVNQAGAYTLLVQNLDNGCFGPASIALDPPPPPPLAALPATGLLDCFSNSLSLDGSSSSLGDQIVYTWLQDEQVLATTTSPHFTVAQPGSYTLLVTDQESGCTASAHISVLDDRPQGAALTLTALDCDNENGGLTVNSVLGGQAPYLFSVDGGQSFHPGSTFTDLLAGSYSLVIQDSNGCEWDSLFTLPSAPALSLELPDFVQIKLGESVPLVPQITGGSPPWQLIRWTPAAGLSCTDCLSPQASPTSTHQYTLELTDARGCTAVASMFLTVDQRPSIYIPNAFSPHNEDGVNDRFTLYAGPELVEEIERLLIFDRWGNELFSRSHFSPNDPSLGWDGRSQGQALNTGVFVYLFELRLTDGRRVTYQGEVVLLD